MLVLLACFFALSSGSICENSPLTPTQLQGILGTALKNLADPLKSGFSKTYTPNLVVGEQPWYSNKKPCNVSKGEVDNCGYPLVFATSSNAGSGSIPSTWTFVSNPSVAYSGALINRTKLLHPTDPVSFSDIAFTIDFSEAIIWLGCTPDVTYFAHSKLLWALRPPVTDPNNEVLGAVGDTLNNYNLKSARTNTSVSGGGATLIIYTSSQTTYEIISKAFVTAGFPAGAINNDAFPTNLVSLGSNGSIWGIGSRNSNLSATETAYLLTPQTGYFILAQELFPYVRLTPAYPHFEDKWNPSIAPITRWIPKVDQTNTVPPQSVFVASETAYEPHLWGVVLTVIAALKTKIAQNANIGPAKYNFNIFPQTASYFEEFGEQYIFEQQYHSKGGTGTRDNNYYFYNPAVVPAYGGNSVTILVGFNHSSPHWQAPPFNKKSPHALFWNLAFNDNTFLGALGGIKGNDPTLQAASSMPALATAPDPAQVIWLRVLGASATTNADLVAVLQSLGFNVPHDNFLFHQPPALPTPVYPLVILHRTYVNPDTGVAPWQGSIVTPVAIHIEGTPISA